MLLSSIWNRNVDLKDTKQKRVHDTSIQINHCNDNILINQLSIYVVIQLMSRIWQNYDRFNDKMKSYFYEGWESDKIFLSKWTSHSKCTIAWTIFTWRVNGSCESLMILKCCELEVNWFLDAWWSCKFWRWTNIFTD